jgi:hypothetical protein
MFLHRQPLVGRWRADVPPALEAVIYRALRRKPSERYQSMADVRHELAHLDSVVVPTYAPDILPPRPLGDLPPLRTTVPILLVIFGVLVGLRILAEVAHRTLPPR